MSSKREPVRLSLIGIGSIGCRHLDLIAADELCQLVAVVDPVAPSGDLNVPHYHSHLEMLDKDRPDGVIVAAPTQLPPSHLSVAAPSQRHSAQPENVPPIATLTYYSFSALESTDMELGC